MNFGIPCPEISPTLSKHLLPLLWADGRKEKVVGSGELCLEVSIKQHEYPSPIKISSFPLGPPSHLPTQFRTVNLAHDQPVLSYQPSP